MANYEHMDKLEALGVGGFARQVLDTIDRIETAEKEISRAICQFPLMADRIWNSFLLLHSPLLEGTAGERIFRAHCREILRRVVEGQPMDKPTAAEVLGLLAEVSREIKLPSGAMLVFSRRFNEVFAGYRLPEAADLGEWIEHLEFTSEHEARQLERWIGDHFEVVEERRTTSATEALLSRPLDTCSRSRIREILAA